MAVQKTTIQIEVELRDKLLALGKKGETYSDIIRKLIENYNERKTKR